MNRHPRILISSHAASWFAIAVVSLLGLSIARAAGPEDGIVVRSTGTASARPTQVVMSGKLSAEAELAADAVVKFRDAKKRALAAIAALKNSDLSVVPGGVSVASGSDSNAQMMAMRGISVPSTGQKVRISETNRILLTHADKLESDELLEKLLKILDVAKDAGFQFSQPATNDYYEMQRRAQEGDVVVSFMVPDSTLLRDRAYKAAIDDAKTKALKLAELMGSKLGPIVSVHEEGAGTTEPDMPYSYVRSINQLGSDDKALLTTRSADITFRLSLTVRFEIAK